MRETKETRLSKGGSILFNKPKGMPNPGSMKVKIILIDEDISLSEFNLIRVLGRGAFGKVMLVEKKDTKKLYALKSINKHDIIEKDQIEHMKTERRILEYVRK